MPRTSPIGLRVLRLQGVEAVAEDLAHRRVALSGQLLFDDVSTVALAAAETGLPPNVEMLPAFHASAICGGREVAAIGSPLAIPLAIVMMSGSTPWCSMPHIVRARAPEAGLHLVADEQRRRTCGTMSTATLKYSVGRRR